MSSTPASSDDEHASSPELFLSNRVYGKIVLHAAKYPHCAVHGLLLSSDAGKSGGIGGGPLQVTDCIPLFHQSPSGLTPMWETALAFVEATCRKQKLALVGVYHANELLSDVRVDTFTLRVADKLAANNVHAPGTVVVTVDNRRLGQVLESHPFLVSKVPANGSAGADLRRVERMRIQYEANALEVASGLIQKKLQSRLVDFDNHLDDLGQDYLNFDINLEIDQM